MMSGKNQSGQQPSALGSMLQASTYGMTIPCGYGRTISPLLAIWANGFRQGGSTKKLKQLKKGTTAYCENIDFLLGTNPILGVLQFWCNNAKIPLDFTTYTHSGGGSITIPDSHFYAVIGVTITGSYSQTFNDYGAAGSSTVSGSYEIPLWNELLGGPDPTHGSALRNYPYCYRWQPSYGATVHIDYPDFFVNTVTIHYARTKSATSYVSPVNKLRMHFESTLGDGDEYGSYPAEQILYPQYAGCGSASLDLGSSGTIPSMIPETQFQFGVYPEGDADYVDIIEDILKSGIRQSAIGGSLGLGYGATQTGVALSDYPGCIQRKVIGTIYQAPTVPYNLPTTAGNFLVVMACNDILGPGATLGISDTTGNTWTPIFPAGNSMQAWYAQAVGGACTVSISGFNAYNTQVSLFEVAGVDSFDSVVVGTPGKASITTTNAVGFPAYVLGLGLWNGLNFPAIPDIPNWHALLTNSTSMYGNASPYQLAFERRVNAPTSMSLTFPGAPPYTCMLAFKCVQPPKYPKPLLDILDLPSLELTRAQCRAGGLWGSLAMTAQKEAGEWIKDLVAAANCSPVWSGFRLKLIPRSEVSAAGNGAVYIAPTASGPVADLDADKGDFIGETPITVVRTARADLDTVLQMQHLNRNSDYHQVTTSMPDPTSIALYGVRKKDPVVNNAIQDVAVALPLLRIMVRRKNYVDPLMYKFKLNARWQMLEPMDLVTITDRAQGIVKVPVRLQSAEEDAEYAIDCEAEPFVYGIHAPQALSVADPTPYRPDLGASAGNVNAPVIFEPVVRLYGSQNQPQLWLVVSNPNAAYGGCQVMISTDGGLSYNSAGDPILGNGVTGVTVGSWPGAASPDTANNLAVDLTESLGNLSSYQVTDEDNYVYPCYVAGTSTPVPYELMTYAVATMTAANKYTLKATGTGNHLDRGVFGAPALGVGATHAGGSRFALLPPDGLGMLKLTMDPLWVGKTLYFKFLSFNTFGTGIQALGDVSPYTYTPTGGSGSVNPGGLPVVGFQINGI